MLSNRIVKYSNIIVKYSHSTIKYSITAILMERQTYKILLHATLRINVFPNFPGF